MALTTPKPFKRSKEIDFLRGIAVLLVVIFHFPLIAIISKMGWIGVDLFFVLSGFLVSGLLFKEYKKYGKVNAKLFLIRRGFKIYPLFYIFIAITFLMHYLLKEPFLISSTVGELFFIRNYLGGYWAHTWSLSVEEHFYFLLVAAVVLLLRKGTLEKPVLVTRIFSAVLIACLFGRIVNLLLENHFGSHTLFNDWARYVHTHNRLDSLLFGTLISYHYHLNTMRFLQFVQRFKKFLLPIFVLGISPAFILTQTTWLMTTIGFTLLYIGFGALLIFFTTTTNMQLVLEKTFSRPLVNAISYCGVYSYSIYLWHVFVREYITNKLVNNMHIHEAIAFSLYFIISIAAGILLSKYVEYYFIKVRDRFFPSAT